MSGITIGSTQSAPPTENVSLLKKDKAQKEAVVGTILQGVQESAQQVQAAQRKSIAKA
jgi:hypothetical protein